MKSFFSASEILKKTKIVDEVEGKYCIINDQSIRGVKFENMSEAINMMAQKGWRCVNITHAPARMYALMERL